MSAVVWIGREDDVVIATDDRMDFGISVEYTDGTSETLDERAPVDGLRKMYRLGDDRILCQGSERGFGGTKTLRPEEHLELMKRAGATESVEDAADVLLDGLQRFKNGLQLYIVGIDETPMFARVSHRGQRDIFDLTSRTGSAGLEPLSTRLSRPIVVPRGRNTFKTETLPEVDVARFTLAQCIDYAAFMIQFAGRYQEFMGNGRPKKGPGLDGRVIGPRVTVGLLKRHRAGTLRRFFEFGNPLHLSQHADLCPSQEN